MIPDRLGQVDIWWERSQKNQAIPAVSELAPNGPDEASTMRVFDLILDRYHCRRQSWLAYRYARDAREGSPRTLLAVWGQAWHTWFVTKYPRENATEIDLRLSLAALSPEARDTLADLVKRCPDNHTGARALTPILAALGVCELTPGDHIWLL